jgi:hypothetical protein
MALAWIDQLKPKLELGDWFLCELVLVAMGVALPFTPHILLQHER